MITRKYLLFTLGLALLTATVQAETHTYPQLVKRMTDMEELAQLPPPGEKTSLASSYDRSRKYDATTDKYINWGANSDGGGVAGHENGGSILADIPGPGCIWRIWTATAGDGHVKIYLDGAITPAVDLPFTSYFDGKTGPFNRPNLDYIPAQVASPRGIGFDNYTPISFQKSCRVVAEKG